MGSFEYHVKLTYTERVLLYLLEFERYKERHTYPYGVTQRGIAEAIDILPAHVPRTVKKLIVEKLVEERFGRVEGSPRKVRVYFLTETGVQKANELKQRILCEKVMVKHGERNTEKEISELTNFHKSFFMLLKAISACETIELDKIGQQPEPKLKRYVELWYTLPELSEFFGREEELSIIESILNSEKPRFISIIGPWGAGKSALAYKCLERVKRNSNILWYTLKKNESGWNIITAIARFLGEMGKKTLEELIESAKEIDIDEFLRILSIEIEHMRCVIVIDEYQNANEEIVDVVSSLVKLIREGIKLKLIITMRADTPSYMWYYSSKDIEEGYGIEIRLQGVEWEEAKQILKNTLIPEENMRQIMMLTKGLPGVLKAMAQNNERILRENTRLTPEEIRLLMFLKDTKTA
jgi:DNA-binding MarR family transcriptional regulator